MERALAAPRTDRLAARVSEFRHPMLPPTSLDVRRGLTPDSAAVVAVLVNPGLRSLRDRRGVASAQLLQAGLLPNPTLDAMITPVTGGNTLGTTTGWNLGLNWEVTALLTHDAKVAAARAASQSVRLDVAWQEWQFAQAARKAVYDLVALQAQVDEALAVDRRLSQNMDLIRRAVDAGQKTILDLAAAEAASQKAHADLLAAQRDLRLAGVSLNQALGLSPDAKVAIAPIELPSRLSLPSQAELFSSLDSRLDLMALRRGYESQEQTVRLAVLQQFPKIVLGFQRATDTTNVHTIGLGATIDLPIFDHNQAAIALASATRQQLFDEYVSRVFDARSAVVLALVNVSSLTVQIADAQAAIPKLQFLVDTYRRAMAQGNIDVLSYYTAQNDLAQRRIDLWRLRQQLMDNKIALEIASGRYIPDTLPAPASRPTPAEARP